MKRISFTKSLDQGWLPQLFCCDAIRNITSVWDEFPEIARPERSPYVSSVWDEVEENERNPPPQQGFSEPAPGRKGQFSYETESFPCIINS